MTQILQIGNLKLDMGSVSHAIGLPNTEQEFQTFLKYRAYQSKFK